jgi:hypothetical protein
MPPQQPHRLLDLVDEAFDFGAHDFSCRFQLYGGDVTAPGLEGNSASLKSV